MARRSGLGRGLGAIIPPEATSEAAEQAAGELMLREVPVSAIDPNRYQPRRHFDEATIAELAASIREVGVLQPILVRQQADGQRYELVAGERRWRAAQHLGLDRIPALVRVLDDAGSLERALIENLHREDLDPMEEAAAYQQLVDEFSLTQEQIAERVGRSRSAVANTLRLLQLPPAIQRMVADGALAAGHARALLGIADPEFQETLARKIAGSGLSVRQVEEAVRAHAAQAEADAPEPGRTKPPALLELEELLSERLATRVRVGLGARKGKIEIDFADLEDLERIFRLLT